MRVLVDSSVWIDHLRGVRSRETAILGSLLAWLDPELEPGDGRAPANVLVGDFVLAKGPLRVHRLSVSRVADFKLQTRIVKIFR